MKLHGCKHCLKRFCEESHLAQHMKDVHVKNECYECSICKLEYKSKKSLHDHTKNMHNQKTRIYNCDKCDYSSKDKKLLKAHHEAEHDGIRYKCTFCNDKLRTKQLLKKHIRNIHNMKGKCLKFT